MDTLATLFSIASLTLPGLIAWLAVQYALLHPINHRIGRPLSNSQLLARAALGVGAGLLLGVAVIGLLWGLVAVGSRELGAGGFLVILGALPVGAIAGMLFGHRMSRRWVMRAAPLAAAAPTSTS